jgi:hypothetical protein
MPQRPSDGTPLFGRARAGARPLDNLAPESDAGDGSEGTATPMPSDVDRARMLAAWTPRLLGPRGDFIGDARAVLTLRPAPPAHGYLITDLQAAAGRRARPDGRRRPPGGLLTSTARRGRTGPSSISCRAGA